MTRPRGNLAVSTLEGQRLSLAPYLKQQTGKVIDLSVRLGSIPALWLTARLLALPVSPEVAEQRRAHVREKAKKQGHVPSTEALALADWNLIVTNIPTVLLQAEASLALVSGAMADRVVVQTLEESWACGRMDQLHPGTYSLRVLCQAASHAGATLAPGRELLGRPSS